MHGAVFNKNSMMNIKHVSILLRGTDDVECYKFSINEEVLVGDLISRIYELLRSGPSPLNPLQDYLKTMSLHKFFPHIMNQTVDGEEGPLDLSKISRGDLTKASTSTLRRAGSVTGNPQPQQYVVHASCNVRKNKTTGNELMKDLGTRAGLTFLPDQHTKGKVGLNRKKSQGDSDEESSEDEKVVAHHIYKSSSSKRKPRELHDYLKQMTAVHNLLAMSKQLKKDASEEQGHKYFAHQMALYYQCLNLVSTS